MGCSGEPDPGPGDGEEGTDTSEHDEGSDDGEGADGPLPQVSAEFGSSADMEFSQGPGLEGLQVEVLTEGDGEPVAEGAAVLADYAGHVWGQEEPFDSSFDRGEPSLFSLNAVVAGWAQGIPGHPVGSRLLISIPPDLGYGPAGGNAGAGIGAEDTIVFVVDIIETIGTDVAGDGAAPIVTDAEELPVTIDGDLGQPAEVTVRPGATEPSEPEVQIVAEGDGDPVALGTQAVVAYSIVTWANDERESTWAAHQGTQVGPEVVGVGMGQWVDLLVDIPEGSRVLVTLPGNEDNPGVALLTDVLRVHGG